MDATENQAIAHGNILSVKTNSPRAGSTSFKYPAAPFECVVLFWKALKRSSRWKS